MLAPRRTVGVATQPPRSGFALIDAVLALAILALTVAGLIALLRQTLSSVDLATSRARAAAAAGNALASVSVRDITWLDQHLGTGRYQTWTLQVDRVAPTLYRASIADTLTTTVWVASTFYRAIPQDTNAVH
jgi:Tfp pilus assembly protein PilV